MKHLLLTAFIAITSLSFSQNEFAWHWHFGDGASLDFSSGTPVAGTSSMYSAEGCVSPSDQNGNLLFYSNGGSIHQNNDGFVWESSGQVMANGELFDTAGCYSTIQSSIVVPVPESASRYYLFTLDCDESSPQGLAHYKGLRYSIIDMSMNGGAGEVITKGVHILGDTTNRLSEGMTVARHANGSDFWLITHSEDQDIYYKILISSTGVGTPTSQTIGSNHGGHIKVSVQGDRLAYGSDVFDFDNSTGMLSNLRSIGNMGTGKAFSMDGRYLYSSNAFDLEQYDLNAPNLAASKVVIFTGNVFSVEIPMALQMGPDCKIYVSFFDKNYIGVINEPNNGGAAANFVKNQVMLTGGTAAVTGLPSFIDTDFIPCDGSGLSENTAETLDFGPNPTTGKIQVFGIESTEMRYEVMTTTGRVCGSGVLSSDQMIDLSHYSNGFYLIRVYNDTMIKTGRVLLEK